ncbi:MAG: hypothetical protein IJ234_10740 [Clostridia bacterium]|nr:hypothetical protein [Clostridia bacterium]
MKRWKWSLAWLVQLVEMFVAGALLALLHPLGNPLYAVCAWGALPMFGLYSAYRATMRGLLNYAAWLAPPIAMAATHWLIWTYPPSPAPVFFCAFTAIIGAAAGEVRKQQRRKHTHSQDGTYYG